MRILFSALHFGLFKNFESVICLLAERGHNVHLAADVPDSLGNSDLIQALTARYPANITWGWIPSYLDEPWFPVAQKIRQGLDWLRFLDDRYRNFPKLRERSEERVPRALRSFLHIPGMNFAWFRHSLGFVLENIERAMPSCTAMDEYLRTRCPDVVLLTSVTNSRSPQMDHLRSTRAAKIPTGVCVYSWDHLSSKSLIRIVPETVFVWNETQRNEAIEMHGLPGDRIVVTGAQCYDQWFDREPSRTHQEFCISIGLDPNKPFILYLCSVLTPDPRESRFVERWLQAIRQDAEPVLRDVGIIIRPHPERQDEWKTIDLSRFENVVVAGKVPTNDQAKADYFDAVAHSQAVVGLVTSAFLEAAIVGRPVLTILDPELWRHQEGMLHFRYLLEVEDGLLTVGRNLPEHIEQLMCALDGRLLYRERQKKFLKAFVRPRGMDCPATPMFVESVEKLASTQVSKISTVEAVLSKLAVSVLVWAAHFWPVRSLLMDVREATENRNRTVRLRESRRQYRRKWRKHRRRKFMMRVRSRWRRVQELIKNNYVSKRKWRKHRRRKFMLRVQSKLGRVRALFDNRHISKQD